MLDVVHLTSPFSPVRCKDPGVGLCCSAAVSNSPEALLCYFLFVIAVSLVRWALAVGAWAPGWLNCAARHTAIRPSIASQAPTKLIPGELLRLTLVPNFNGFNEMSSH